MLCLPHLLDRHLQRHCRDHQHRGERFGVGENRSGKVECKAHMMCLPHLPGSSAVWEPSVKNGFQNLKRDLSGVRFGGFFRVIRELQIVNDGFKSAVILQL